MEEPSGMDLVSERLANVSRYDEGELRMRAAEEHSIIFGQVLFVFILSCFIRRVRYILERGENKRNLRGAGREGSSSTKGQANHIVRCCQQSFWSF